MSGEGVAAAGALGATWGAAAAALAASCAARAAINCARTFASRAASNFALAAQGEQPMSTLQIFALTGAQQHGEDDQAQADP